MAEDKAKLLKSLRIERPAEAPRAPREMGLEGRRPRADLEQHLQPEERRAHLGLRHRGNFHPQEAADRHQLHGVPTRLFRRDPLVRQGHDRLDGAAHRSPTLNDGVIKTIDQLFANSSYETATDTEKALNKAFVAQFGNIALIVVLVVGAAFVTILMIVGNTMALSVRQRTREIGVLKTLGFSGTRILRLVLGESIMLALKAQDA